MLSPANSSPSVYPLWTDLPSDLTANILERLGAEEILSAQFVCATWWKVCQNPALWRIIKIVNRDNSEHTSHNMMCHRAVDLSQGQLIDLTIAYFGDWELLHYVVDRSSNLQRLTLVYCSEIDPTSLVEAVKKLKKLEELHLNINVNYFVDMKEIGNACPMLKCFTFNYRRDEYYGFLLCDCNQHALAIAKTMPNLHHLVLLRSDMNHRGLQAILNGCPRLESLDLRECAYVDLSLTGCFMQIKHIKLPSDSTADYEWATPTFEEDLMKSFDVEWQYQEGGRVLKKRSLRRPLMKSK